MFNKVILSLFLFFSITSIQEKTLNAAQNPILDQGNASAKKGSYREALIHLNAAIQAEPQNARAYKLRGHVYYAMGNYSKAYTDLDHVVVLAPNSANALVDRAIIYSVTGKHGLALVDIEHALKLKPESTFAKSVRKEILERAK